MSSCILPKCDKFQSAIQRFHIKHYFGCLYTKKKETAVYLSVYRIRFKMQDTRIEVHDYRDWNALPDSLISSAESPEDGVAKVTSLVRARH